MAKDFPLALQIKVSRVPGMLTFGWETVVTLKFAFKLLASEQLTANS